MGHIVTPSNSGRQENSTPKIRKFESDPKEDSFIIHLDEVQNPIWLC